MKKILIETFLYLGALASVALGALVFFGNYNFSHETNSKLYLASTGGMIFFGVLWYFYGNKD